MISKKLNNLCIVHWNANSIGNKVYEFFNFLDIFSPDIVSINEAKCSETLFKEKFESLKKQTVHEMQNLIIIQFSY